MTYDANSGFPRKAYDQESVFLLRIVRVIKKYGVLIIKYCRGFQKRNAVLFYVCLILVFVPFELHIIISIIII